MKDYMKLVDGTQTRLSTSRKTRPMPLMCAGR